MSRAAGRGNSSQLLSSAGLRVITCGAALLVFNASEATAQQDTTVTCEASATDQDDDGLADECEFTLATAFAPALIARSGGCNWDETSRRLGGGYMFAVTPVDSAVRIVYMPAYFRDCGWRGPKCWLPWVDCAPHAGDSEVIAVDVRQNEDDRTWRVAGIFLSAHCFGRSGTTCRWYRGQELDRFTWVESAPIVWVAEGRNANYPSRVACDSGHHSIDTCDHNDVQYRFPVAAERNIGSRQRPVAEGGCIAGTQLNSPMVVGDVVECFWRPEVRFRGWQDSSKGVTGYFRYLQHLGVAI